MKDPYSDARSLPYRFRKRRFVHVRRLIQDIIAEKGFCRIVDLGGRATYWKLGDDLFAGGDVEVHLVNPATERVPPGGRFVSITADATDLDSFADMSYDLVHSNSVIEHVGDWRRMERMAQNVRRLAPRYFVQTPYLWFPVEPHFRAVGVQWLPEQWRMRLLMHRQLGFVGRQENVGAAMREIQSRYLLDWCQFSALFPDAELVPERFLGLTKSMLAIRKEMPGVGEVPAAAEDQAVAA